MAIDRRLFLLSTAALPLYAGPLTVLSESEARLVSALTDRIIPADDAPGAEAAGVVFYIDKQLAGQLRRYLDPYRSGIARFQTTCREHTGRSFSDLEAADQDKFLQQVDSRKEWKLQAFFSMLVDHTMQGFYGSPDHGGNRGEASWKMLGIADVMGGHRH